MWRFYAVLRGFVGWIEGPTWEQRRRRPERLHMWAYRAGKALERRCTERTGRNIYGQVW